MSQPGKGPTGGTTPGTRPTYDELIEQLARLRQQHASLLERMREKEAALLQREERHRLALAAGAMATWDWHVPSGEVSWNEEHFRMLGYEPGSIPPSYEAWADRVHPEDRSATEKLVQANVAQGGEFRTEFRVLPPNGTVRWIEARGRTERDEAGRPLRQYGVMLDITERKRDEEVLRRYKLLAGHSRDIVLFMRSEDGRILEANAAALNAYGYSREEMLSLSIRDLRALDTESLTKEQMAIADARGILFETVHRRKDGSTFPVEVSSRGATIDGTRTLISVVRDTAERKRSEEKNQSLLNEVRAEKDRLSALIASMTDEVWFADKQKQFTLVNPPGVHEFNLGFSLNATGVVKLAESLEVLRPDGSPRPVEEAPPLRALLGEIVRNQEEIIRTPATGELRHRQVSASPVKNAHGEIIGSVSVVRDITERKRAEEALRESEDRHRLLAETMLQGVVHQDLRGSIISMNAAAERILGKTRDEFLGSSSVREEHDSIREDGSAFPGLEHPSMVALRTGNPVRNVVMGVFNPRENGYRWISVDAVPLLRPGEKTPYEVYAVFADVTERKRAEEAQRAGAAILSGVLDSSRSGIMAFKSLRDATGRIKDFEWQLCNATAERMVGRRAPDLIGHNLLVEMPGNKEDGLFDKYVVVVETGKSLHHEHYYEHEGLKHWFDTSAVKLGDGFAVTFSDISDRKRVEEQLRENEQQLRDIIDGSPASIVFLKDLEGRFITINKRLEDLLGQSRDALRGKTDYDIFPAEKAEYYREHDRRIIETGESLLIEEMADLPDGKRHTFLASKFPLRDPSGRIYGVGAVSQDISQVKDAEEGLRRRVEEVETLMQVAPVAIWVANDPECHDIVGNRKGNEFYEADEGENVSAGPALGAPVPPRHFFMGGREVVADELPMQVAAAQNVDVVGSEFDVVLSSGLRRTLSGNASPLRDSEGKVRGCIGAFVDITERKQAEDALREADRRKNEFLGVLSHELRNPLTPIRNSLYILDRTTPGSEQARRAHSVIDRQVGHLSHLVDDLLDVTRITRGKIRLQRTRVDFVDLVRRTVEDHRSLLEQHEIAIELPSETIWIDADPTRLAQVLGNLLHNAAKFTPEDGKIAVSLTQAEGRAVLEVADTGMGIDAETLNRLFEPFAQADRSLDRSRGGLGLGLALVKGMVELHGGEVSARSDGPGKGARFTIKLPVDASGATTHAAQPPKEAASNGRAILIIEDNRDAADSLSEALALSGHRVAVACDGETGLAKAREFQPEVVLCDIGLPEMDGYAVARAFRADDGLKRAFLVALSGYALPEDLQRAREAGFDRHLAKPPSIEKLEELLAEVPRHSTGSTEADSTPSPDSRH